MLRDRIVCGINDEHIQTCLLAESTLTYTKAVDIAQGMEAAARNSQILLSSTILSTDGEIHKVCQTRRKCYRCGKTNHIATQCRFKNAKCHNCGKEGHISTVCRSKVKSKPNVYVNRPAIKRIDEYVLFQLKEKSSKPLQVDVSIDGKPVPMEIDTGASVSVMSEETFNQLWPDHSLQKSQVKLQTYSGEDLDVLGEVRIEVQHSTHKAQLPLIILRGTGLTLMGRDWLCQFRLDRQKILKVTANPNLANVLQGHQKLFQGGLGTFKIFTAKIHVDPALKPRFYKPRPVPYAMRVKVEKELDRFVKSDIITQFPSQIGQLQSYPFFKKITTFEFVVIFVSL